MKNRLVEYLFSVVIVLGIVKIFLSWFIMPHINGGDWPYYANGMFGNFPILAPLWTGQGGMGSINPDFPNFSYLYFTIGFFVNTLHVSWDFVYKIMWFGLSLMLGSVSIISLYKTIKKDASSWEVCLSAFLYLCNTYFLMISAGGQLGIVLAYSIAPLVLASAIQSIHLLLYTGVPCMHRLRYGLLLGLVLSVEMLFDPRITFLTVGLVLLYFLYAVIVNKKLSFIPSLQYFFIAFLLLFLLHSYWILPFYLFKLFFLSSGLISGSSFAFFSFADFSHAFSLLHPNWPDNIFGKVSFLQPEFLVFPLFAFSGLFFTKNFLKDSKYFYLFFGLLGLIGVFLAKGVNEPFQQANSWLFNHIPGFNLFRDPTKYYLFIALAYSVMIPFSLKIIYNFLPRKTLFQSVFFCVLLVALLFPIRQALSMQLGGTFASVPIPDEYVHLNVFLSSQSKFFRTLWIPTQSRFRYSSEQHPMVTAESIFNTMDTSAIIKKLRSSGEEKRLQDLGIKYIVIPYDSTAEIFLSDRNYDARKRQDLLDKIETIPWLKKIQFGKIVLYEVPNFKDHFWIIGGGPISYQRNSISDYTANVRASHPQMLVFSESYHPGWVEIIHDKKVKSMKTEEGLNSFMIPADQYNAHIYFEPQQYQKYFYGISGGSLLAALILLIFT